MRLIAVTVNQPLFMRIVILIVLSAIIPIFLLAQPSTPEKKENSINPGAEIYNGKMHTNYLPAVLGTAYFLNGDWQPGNLVYHDIFYPVVWLKYDLVQNELIIQHSNGVTPIILFTPRVQYFAIAGNNFIRVENNDSLNLPPGIYQEKEKGIMNFYIARSKYLVEEVTQNEIERKFFEKNKYYMVKDGVCLNIQNQSDIWKLVKDKKSFTRIDLKRKGLKFKKNPEATLTEIAKYYNETGK